MQNQTNQQLEAHGCVINQSLKGPIDPFGAANEQDLINLVRQGSCEAYDELIVRYQSQAFRMAYRMTGDPETAYDALQDAFLSAYLQFGRFHGETIRPWLLRIVTNACIDAYRRAARCPQISLDQVCDFADMPSMHTGTPTPEQALEHAELQYLLARSLLRLPADHRLVLILSDLHELSYQEIAEFVRAPVGTVKSRLSRARAAMRSYLSKEVWSV